jgi:predicted transcriptional regulator
MNTTDKQFFGSMFIVFGLMLALGCFLPIMAVHPFYGVGGFLVIMFSAGGAMYKLFAPKKEQKKQEITMALKYLERYNTVSTGDLIREYNMTIKQAQSTIDTLVKAGIIGLDLQDPAAGLYTNTSISYNKMEVA